MMMTDAHDDQVNAIAYLVEHQRARRPFGPWDRPGIVANLRKLCCTVGAALDAALAAANDPNATTPAAIGFPQYWPRQQPPPKVDERTCERCSRTETICRRIYAREIANGTPDAHEFTPG